MSISLYSAASVAKLIIENGYIPYISRYGCGVATLSALDCDNSNRLIAMSIKCSEAYIVRLYNSLGSDK